MPGFDHPRLTERLRALAETQEDVDHHTVKMDFINKINRIPHHKRLTKHHNRRVTEVPPAVKVLYAHPLPDVAHVPSLSDCLLTPEEGVEQRRREGVEQRRREEERERKQFVAPRQPAFTRDQDEWTRKAILCQLEHNSSSAKTPLHLRTHRHHHHSTQSPASLKSHLSSSPISMTTTLNGNESTDSISPSASCPDFSIFLAAHKLLELSGRGSLPNGIARISPQRITGREDDQTNNSLSSQERLLKGPDTNLQGNECTPQEKVEEPTDLGKGNCSDNHSDRQAFTGTSEEAEEEENENRDTLESRVSEPAEPRVETEPKAGDSQDDNGERETPLEACVAEEASPGESGHQSCDESMELELGDSAGAAENPALFSPGFVPDLDLLDERLVRLLAVQRVRQLFAAGSGHVSDKGVSPQSEEKCMDIPEPLSSGTGRHLNGLRPVLLPKLAKPVFSADTLKSAPAILCPVSGIGLAHPFQKVVTSVGTGSEMDVCLLQYSHCNFISPRHASVFFDKATEEYELINYSDHGSVVDGVLYSCDFSDKGREDGNKLEPPVFMLDDLTARGVGLRAERARARIEEARKSLEERERARRALEGALKLARPSLSVEDSVNGGTRNHSDSRPVLLGSKRISDTSVVSIPLSKTKRHCSEDSPKKASPQKSPQKPSPKTEKGIRNTNHERDSKTLVLKCHEELGRRSTERESPSPVKNTSAESKSSPREPSQLQSNLIKGETVTFSQPCMCKRSASSLVGSNGKGWEGTATLYHGSRLRFGCIQFVLSIAGRPGHGELVKALVELNDVVNASDT